MRRSLPRFSDRAQSALRQASATERMLADLEDVLLKIAERGSTAQSQYAAELEQHLRRLESSGLSLLPGHKPFDAPFILKARYVTQIAQECLQRS